MNVCPRREGQRSRGVYPDDDSADAIPFGRTNKSPHDSAPRSALVR
jgi:hypothetical protein